MLKTSLNICFLFFGLVYECISQSPCANNYAIVLGSIIEDERGYSLAASPDENVIYLAGIKNDSAAIIKIDPSGEIQWTRTFDVIPGEQDHIYRILLDSEGMLGVSGIGGNTVTGGTVFGFRYDPKTNVILWSNQFNSTSRSWNLALTELGPGGNYLMSNNPQAPNNAELLELNRSTGVILNKFSKHYDLGSSETLGDFIYHNDKLYSCGRFTDGGSAAEMRNTLIKLNPDNGIPEWVKMGHKPANQTARLYGVDLAIAQDEIYNVITGDIDGTSIDITDVLIQKTSLEGDLIWLKRYDLPGTNDWADEIMKVEDGLIILARNRNPPSDIFLFKINYNGEIQWSKKFDFSDNDNSVAFANIQSQLIEFDNHIYFTAFAEGVGSADMILVRTDLQGEIDDTCNNSSSITITVTIINNPVFYFIQPTIFTYLPELVKLPLDAGNASGILTRSLCYSASMINSVVEVTICEGDQYEGYTVTGQYIDQFITTSGCDSSRTLNLEVVNEILISVDKDICLGESYGGYSASGMFVDTFASIFGCDSIRTLNLSLVLQVKIQEVELCSGNHFENYTEAGIYTDTLKGLVIPCDTIRQLTVSLLPPIEKSFFQAVCMGQNYFGYTTPGIYTDTLKTSQGCDSIRTVSIDVINQSFSFVNASLCDGYLFGHNIPGIYIDTLEAVSGCDSIRTLELSGGSKYIPNVFSPNNDDINDVFKIFQFPDNSLDLQYFGIFDRFGNMAYETEKWPIEWSGKRRNGESYNPGVFTYVMVYTCGEKKITETGDITIVR